MFLPDPKAMHKQAALDAYERGRSDAGALISAALARLPGDQQLLIADASVSTMAGADDALERLTKALRADPQWTEGHRALVQLRTMFALPNALSSIEDAMAIHPYDAHLLIAYLGMLGGTGRYEEAASKARNFRDQTCDIAGLRLIEARFMGFAGKPHKAQSLLDKLPAGTPELDYELARNAMRLVRWDDASRAIDRAIGADANGPRVTSADKNQYDIGIWALAELCWRQLGDPRHAWLFDRETMTGQFPLPIEKSDLAEVLRLLPRLHVMHSAPLGQSVSGGTQTLHDLQRREEPAIAALFDAARHVLGAFTKQLGALSADHPLRALCGRMPDITASWSIRLTGGGRHFPHLHNSGLVSSAMHLAIPRGLEEGEGALELGRPPEDITGGPPPAATIMPKPGNLVLFPSYLYHGTSQFSQGERLTVAFDAR